MKTISRRAAALALAVMAAGCGGGGSNGGGGTVNYRAVLLTPSSLLGLHTAVWAANPAGAPLGGNSHTGFVGTDHALLWPTATTTGVVDLGPGEIRAVGSDVQIGFTGVEGQSSQRAHLWRGTAASIVDLHPAAYIDSIAYGGDATVQVGLGHTSSTMYHALLWRGTAASVVDLHPAAGFTRTRAYGASGLFQVGTGETTGGVTRALLWQGTAASMVDLHPAGYTRSVGWATSDTEQVGQGNTSAGLTHALLWRGTAASIVDLHPPGFSQSYGFGVAGGRQAGYGITNADNKSHALVWEGTAGSVKDLHSVTSTLTVGGEVPSSSIAHAIDQNGNVYGEVRISTNQSYAVMWERL